MAYYLWNAPENYPNKCHGIYDNNSSISSIKLLSPKKITLDEYQRCDIYVRSEGLIIPYDDFIRCVVNHNGHPAYIFVKDELFYFNSSMPKKIDLTNDLVLQLKNELGLTEADIDQEGKAITDEQLNIISKYDCPLFSRVPISKFSKPCETIAKYDNVRTGLSAPVVNQKIKNILLEFASDEVQFFPIRLICSDGELFGYEAVNVTTPIIGMDHEKSVYKTSKYDIKHITYLTYLPGCMENHQIGKSIEAYKDILINEELKQAFDKAKVKGVVFETPEAYYEKLYPYARQRKEALEGRK